ncbi:MAG: CBS domain-containing protein [Deltaproteobacteria bacterium]|nr:CBS domain-containing protein [Deltaproteobacteria bacterium]
MIKAKDVMTRDVVTVTPDMEVNEIAKLLLERHFNGVPVIDGAGRLVGIICQSDLIAEQKKLPLPSVFTILDSFIPIRSLGKMDKEVHKIAAIKASEAMTPNPVTVGPEAGIDEVAEIMVNRGFHTIPVVEGEKLVGIIGKEDVLRTLVPSDKAQCSRGGALPEGS